MLLFLPTLEFPEPFSLLLSAAKLLKSVAYRASRMSNFSPKPIPIRLSLTDPRPTGRLDQGRPRPRVLSASKAAGRLPGRKPAPTPTHLRLHVQLRATRAGGCAMEEDRGPGLPGPAFSRLLAKQSTHAPGSGGHQLCTTPATFEFQRLPPHSPRSARRDQWSPSPQPRANHSALRLPRPHPAGPAPSPSSSAGAGEASRLVTLPARFSSYPPLL